MKLSNITKKFGDNTVLNNFSLELKNDEKVILTGASGIGKTTVLNIISGLISIDSGSVECEETVAYMFQEHRLLPWLSAEENILAVLKGDSAPIAQKYIDLVGIMDFCNKKPAELSGGMAQRVSFVRFLAYAEEQDATLLLLDEPFSALDSELAEKMANILQEFSKDKALILVTHSEDDIKIIGGKIVQI